MATTETDVANIALSLLGEKRITDIDGGSVVATKLQSQFDFCRQELLRAHPWNFAIKRAELTANATAPIAGRAYAYDLPADWLKVHELNGPEFGMAEATFALEGDQLLADVDTAYIRYVYDVTDPDDWDQLFVKAFALHLAAECALDITNSVEKAALMQQKLQLFAWPEAKYTDSTEDRKKVIHPLSKSRNNAFRGGGGGLGGYNTFPSSFSTAANFTASGMAALIDSATAVSAFENTDQIPFARDVSGSPALRSMSWANFSALVNGSAYGWADYADTTYTSGSPLALAADTDTRMEINGVNGPKTYEPADIDLYDTTNFKIPGREGDVLMITVEMQVVPTNANTTYLEWWVDIGGAIGELYRRPFTFPKGNGVLRGISFTQMAYTLDTWEANGGTMYIRANNTANVYDMRVFISRIYAATT